MNEIDFFMFVDNLDDVSDFLFSKKLWKRARRRKQDRNRDKLYIHRDNSPSAGDKIQN